MIANRSVTAQRIPIAKESDYDVYDCEWGNALSLGYETETFHYVFGAGTTFWLFYGDEPSRSIPTLDAGLNFRAFRSNGHVKWRTRFQNEVDGTAILSAGPTVYFLFSIRFMGNWNGDTNFMDDTRFSTTETAICCEQESRLFFEPPASPHFQLLP